MHETLVPHATSGTDLGHQIYGRRLEHAGPDRLLDLGLRPAFNDDRLDAA
ncbi:hypothetical protein LPJ38_20570 [Bradyrhizobium daqingense]|uniref:Uncharacterized protein n=1 Tax=Bradyrhizobium daqingense TaxID=993502 RepID=A0A562KTL2_9BRAD|nr:hypothetical protein [Bradyrhizobium daqingense]TWH98722.1 hypothetical protein IQ17_05800 [Bradyrhizobium daqingense]UFS86083.1 hypothetical protein LPJ38_20570 [Bradyrhizobium daqingense]